MQSQKLKISVVIPLYNKASHIAQTICYVQNQTTQPYEIIVVNDGSTDNGEQIIENLNIKTLTLINQENSGVSAARNKGIEHAKGDYIALLDADDQWSPHYLEEISRLIEKFGQADVYATAYQCIGNNNLIHNPKIRYKNKEKKPHILRDYLKICSKGDLPFFTSSIVFKKSLVENIGGFPEGEAMGEDQDFFFRAALHANIAYSPRTLSFYMIGSENRACINNLPDYECPFSERLTQLALHPNTNNALSKNLLRCSAAHILHLTRRNVHSGNLLTAKRLLKDNRCKLIYAKYLYLRLITECRLIMEMAL